MPCTTVVMPVFDLTRVIPGAEWRVSAGGATIRSILPMLSRELERPVVDETKLTQTDETERQ
jgi:hypothetical protein